MVRDLAAVLGLSVCLLGVSSAVAQSPPSLGAAGSFAVLGASEVIDTGSTTVAGNVGVSPGNRIVGFPSGTPAPGEMHRDDALARGAHRDALAAFDELGRAPCTALPVLAGILPPGVYCASSPTLSGTLTLDADGDADALWIFQVSGSFATVAASSVVLVNGAKEGNVFWRIDGSASHGSGSVFAGSLFARSNITVASGARVSGRLISIIGAVTLSASRITICCSPMTLLPATLPPGTAGEKYSATITTSEGTAATFAVVAGALPPGLALSPGGVLFGAPSGCGGTYRFTVAATDTFGCPAAAEYSITVSCTTTTGITLSPLPPARIGVPYFEPITAMGGIAPYVFTLTCGTLPDGWTITPFGVVGGIPTTTGTFSFGITATDATGAFGTRCYVLEVSSCPLITISPVSLLDAIVGAPYSATISASGGSGSYEAGAPSADLPPGLSLSTGGVLSGTPAKPGCSTFTVTVRDLATGCIAKKTYTICVRCALTATILPLTLPDGIVGTPYGVTFTVSDGGSYEFSAIPEVLPVSRAGALSGTPTKAGCFTFTVVAVDPVSGCARVKAYTVCFTCPAITVLPPALPGGIVGNMYLETVTATGGTEPYTFMRIAGAFPPDVTLDSESGKLTGPLMTSGLYAFTIQATDSYGCTGTRDYTVVIKDPPPPPPFPNTPALSAAAIIALTILLTLAAFVTMRRAGV